MDTVSSQKHHPTDHPTTLRGSRTAAASLSNAVSDHSVAMMRVLALVFVSLTALAACSDSTADGVDGIADTGATDDSGAFDDTGATDDSGALDDTGVEDPAVADPAEGEG